MAGNTFGKLYKVTTFGESHGVAVGAVIDGCPSNFCLCEDDIQKYLDRRKPSNSLETTRKEEDRVKILSGVFDGKTLGTPICAIVENKNVDISQYEVLKNIYRPGHADLVYEQKYGIRDYRNGGRASGRETIGRVIGGSIASEILKKKYITFETYSITGKEILEKKNIDIKKFESDTMGGRVICIVKGCPCGLGEPVFDKMDAELAKAVMSIGAVKSVEIGAGKDVEVMSGIECNDRIMEAGVTATNNAGGINGGITNGNDIVVTASIKPVPTTNQKQKTIDKYGNEVEIELVGHNDICIVKRVEVVVEAMVAMTILDYLLQNRVYSDVFSL